MTELTDDQGVPSGAGKLQRLAECRDAEARLVEHAALLAFVGAFDAYISAARGRTMDLCPTVEAWEKVLDARRAPGMPEEKP